MRPPMTQCDNRTHRVICLLYWKRLYRLYTRDSRRNKVVEVVCRKNGAHVAPYSSGGGATGAIAMRLKESCEGRKHLSMQAEITIQRRKKERRAQHYLESPSPSPRCRGESSHATRRPIDRLTFPNDSDDKPPRRVATLGIHSFSMRTFYLSRARACQLRIQLKKTATLGYISSRNIVAHGV